MHRQRRGIRHLRFGMRWATRSSPSNPACHIRRQFSFYDYPGEDLLKKVSRLVSSSKTLGTFPSRHRVCGFTSIRTPTYRKIEITMHGQR